ncbi:Retinaldehyde-binding related protein [Operophtera brumata]|uniref:Retinaldehyde-binding related protein n=1 Tax=Operophtera brumata TaxID=104452 RepID=A0A0L7KUB9_OPEBR|nr:Retinaldehyde-binding related protein [Operophtera brumata]
MATSVLQPSGCRRDHAKPDLIQPRVPDDASMHQEREERETGDLPQELREQARVELREELALRDQALAQMRHFIEKHPAIKRCRTDPLDPKISAVIDAGYLVPLPKRDAEGRRVVLSCMGKLDPLDLQIAAVIHAGYLVPVPKRDA